MKCIATAALLSITTASALAQEMPKQVADLGWMVGTWSGSGKIAFGGHETEITSTITASFDGEFLKTVSADKSAGFTLTKTAMIGWDAAKGEYLCYTFTNISPSARIEHGKLEGNKLVMVSEPWEAEGMKLVGRETISKITDSQYGLVLEAKIGDEWEKEMDFILTKS